MERPYPRCANAPTTPSHFRECLAILQRRRHEIERILEGTSLLVRLAAYDTDFDHHVLFASTGHVAVVPPEQAFSPDVEITGMLREIDGFVVGEITLQEAVRRDIVTLHIAEIETVRYAPLRQLVAWESTRRRRAGA